MERSFLDYEGRIILCICFLDDQNCFKKLHVESIESQKIIDLLAKITDSEYDQIKGSLPDVFQHILQTNSAFRKEILMKFNSASNQKSISIWQILFNNQGKRGAKASDSRPFKEGN